MHAENDKIRNIEISLIDHTIFCRLTIKVFILQYSIFYEIYVSINGFYSVNIIKMQMLFPLPTKHFSIRPLILIEFLTI